MTRALSDDRALRIGRASTRCAAPGLGAFFVALALGAALMCCMQATVWWSLVSGCGFAHAAQWRGRRSRALRPMLRGRSVLRWIGGAAAPAAAVPAAIAIAAANDPSAGDDVEKHSVFTAIGVLLMVGWALCNRIWAAPRLVPTRCQDQRYALAKQTDRASDELERCCCPWRVGAWGERRMHATAQMKPPQQHRRAATRKSPGCAVLRELETRTTLTMRALRRPICGLRSFASLLAHHALWGGYALSNAEQTVRLPPPPPPLPPCCDPPRLLALF